MICASNRFVALGALAAMLATGCEAAKDDDATDTAAGTTGSVANDSGTGESTDAMAADSSSDGAAGESGGGNENAASPENCAAQNSEDACDVVPPFSTGDGPSPGYCDEGETCSCEWRLLWPVTIDGDACGFGEPVGRCMFMDFPESGCAGELCGDTETFAVYRQDDDEVLVGYGSGCGDPGEGEAYCSGPDAPAECACACDDGFPG